MVKTEYNTTEGMTKKLQSSGGKTKVKFYEKCNFDDDMNYRRESGKFQFEEDVFSKDAQIIVKIMHEVLLLVKLLQTESQIRCRYFKYYDLYYAVIKN